MLFRSVVILTAMAACCIPASAAIIHQATTADAAITPTDDGYDASAVTIVTDPNAIGPDATGWATGNVGLNRFWNSEFAGFTLSSANGTTLDSSTEFGTGFLQWTVSAASGYELDLTSVEISSARGGGDPASQVRGFKLYAAINGGAFDFGDTPVIDVDNETGTRTIPVLRTGVLTAAAFQNIQSVSFRYYPLSPATGNSMDFARVTLNGDVVAVPEPAGLAIVAAGALLLARRRGAARSR